MKTLNKYISEKLIINKNFNNVNYNVEKIKSVDWYYADPDIKTHVEDDCHPWDYFKDWLLDDAKKIINPYNIMHIKDYWADKGDYVMAISERHRLISVAHKLKHLKNKNDVYEGYHIEIVSSGNYEQFVYFREYKNVPAEWISVLGSKESIFWSKGEPKVYFINEKTFEEIRNLYNELSKSEKFNMPSF